MDFETFNKWEKIIARITKWYSLVPLKDELFKIRCWIFYIVMILPVPLFVNCIFLALHTGAKIKENNFFNNLLFAISLVLLIWVIITTYYNNYILKLEIKKIVKKHKPLLIFSWIILNFWLVYFIKKCLKTNKNF